MEDQPILFRGAQHQLSHMYQCEIALSGNTYKSAEQAYQYIKAKAVHSYDDYTNIMSTDNPFETKLIGKHVQVPLRAWTAVKGYIMYRIDYEKFTQNEDLRSFLLNTGSRPLVENVRDDFWGIGFDGKGRNECGKILEELRSRFINGHSFFCPVYVIGDSLINGIHVPGSTTVSMPGAKSEFVHTAAEAIVGPGAKVVFLLAGTNDLVNMDGGGIAPNLIVKQLLKWSTKFADVNKDQTLVLSTVPPRVLDKKLEKRWKKLNGLLLAAKEQLPANVFIFDATSVLGMDHLATDGLHLSQHGKCVLAGAVAAVIDHFISGKGKPAYLH